ncbi:MAG TPA: ERF family protein [Burkholderiaceae bacterium]|nr:ERF family protein [Burkholderiaceae bacterium]
MKIYQAINAVQRELAAEGISKSRNNQQQGYKFRGIDDVYNAVSPLLGKHSLCILPRMLSRHCDERTNSKGTALFYVTVEAEFDLVAAEDGSKHTIRTFGEAMDSGDKATNKAMSAAYKYAVMQAFAIPTEGDNDADATTHDVAARHQQDQRQDARDTSPKTTAKRIAAGVAGGDAAGAAEWLSRQPKPQLDAIWSELDDATANKLTASWPKVAAA